MRDHTDEIHQAGAELVIVGNGQPNFAMGFKKRLNLTTPLYVDPELKTYQAAGLKRTKLGTIGPRVFLPALGALITGHKQDGVKGDPYQQGGVFVIMPDNKIVFTHISKRASDHAKIPKIIKALKTADKRNTALK